MESRDIRILNKNNKYYPSVWDVEIMHSYPINVNYIIHCFQLKKEEFRSILEQYNGIIQGFTMEFNSLNDIQYYIDEWLRPRIIMAILIDRT